MKNILLVFFIYLSTCEIYLVFTSPIDKNFTLELVQVLFRHGARTPNNCEAKMLSHVDESDYEPWGFSRLTNTGMMEEYRIGQMLRNRYGGFIPEVYKPEDIHAYSSSYDRTKASLQLVLAALYPPTDNLAWNDDLDWMPIPVHSNPRKLDILMKPRDCPKFIDSLKEFYNSTEFEEGLSEHNEIFQQMKNIHGKDFTIDKFICAFHIIVVHRSLNLTLPDWYSEEIFEKLTKATSFYLDTLSYTPVLNRLNGGTLVKRFVENMMRKGSMNRRKLYLYSSHDKNLYAFIKAHGLTLDRFPDFGSTIILEKLRDHRNEAYVKLLMWTGNPKVLKTLKLEKCSEVCPLAEYLKIVKTVIPSDEEMRCLYKNLSAKDIENILASDADGGD